MKTLTKAIVFSTILFLSGYAHAQKAEPRENTRAGKPLSISLYAGSPTLFASIAIDYFIRPSISLEAGAGAFGLYGGGRYHFKGNRPDKNWTTYTGLLFAAYGEAVGTDYLFFVPIGKQYIGKNGFNFAAEISLLSDTGPAYYPFWFGLKFGYRFK